MMPDSVSQTPGTITRLEHDVIGEREMPIEARYGLHALRASENFARPGAQLLRDVPEFCRALAMVKLAAQRANVECGALSEEVGAAIGRAAQELIDDDQALREELIVPFVQGGAGTSTNMNVNEVLANRALEHLGHAVGAYEHCHPNDHVNRSQSTNDVYPTSLRLALILRAAPMERSSGLLVQTLRRLGERYAHTPKLGRTQLQDAVTMSVGDEFHAWADIVASALSTVVAQREALLEVNLGGTAIGTGLTASEKYRQRVVPMLAEISEIPVHAAERPVSATTDTSALLGSSAALRALAIALAKISNDLRLLSSGPFGGLAELRLPAVQSGSSMMPGKVNPVIAEFVNQLAFRVRGSDATVTAALDAGQLQLHAMLPLVASELLNAQKDLTCAIDALCTRCVSGIVVNRARMSELAKYSLGELSTIAARSGYMQATQAAIATGVSPVSAAANQSLDTDEPQTVARLCTETREDS
jgi:aspartate ammonia-lyase